MAVLQTFREKAGLAISIIIALALLSFIIDPSTLETAMNSMSEKYDVGRIAGKNISYTDFQEQIDRYTNINQILTGSSVADEQTQKQIRNSAWQGLVDKYMFIKAAKEAGITVGEDELQNLLSGDNPSPLVAQNPLFAGENGMFDARKVAEFVSNISADESGNSKIYWDYLQNSVYTQQYYAKYGALFTASSVANALVSARAIDENNTTANVDYVVKPYSMALDSTVTVSNDEIKAFYNAHKKEFKQKENRDIEYVLFEVVPSVDDIYENELAFNKAYEEFADAENIKAFCLKNSDEPFKDYWYGKGELRTYAPEIDEFAFSGATGISQIFKSGNTVRAARIVETAMKSDSVFVKHILLKSTDAALADSLLGVVRKGGDFAALAAVYSIDQNSAQDGQLGSIGWMTQNYMIPGFESVIDANAGEPFILNTAYGKHVVMVTRKTKPVLKKKVAVLEKTALASKETFNNYYSQASNFVALAGGKVDGFHKAADSLKVYAHPMQHITEATSQFGGVDNAKEITRWVFDAKKGKSSEIITVNQSYFFVVAVNEIHEEGYASLKEVSSMIQSKLYSDKLMEKEMELVAAKAEGKTDLAQVSEALDAAIINKEGLTFAVLGTTGSDPALLGAAFTAPEGKLVGPVKGQAGIYYLTVNSREKGSFYTAEDAKVFEAQKSQYASQQIIPVMSEAYNLVDNRERFF